MRRGALGMADITFHHHSLPLTTEENVRTLLDVTSIGCVSIRGLTLDLAFGRF
jgi:hypothetical protein